MAERATWASMKGARPDSPERRQAYEQAGRGIEIGRQLFELRQQRGMSQRQLGKLSGVRPGAIDAIEVGSIEGRLDEVERLCIALGASGELRGVATAAS